MKKSAYFLRQYYSLIILLCASALLLFSCLGFRNTWTQEHRWLDIVAGMLYRNDFLHPFLANQPYYDKPLLSYWLIILATKLLGGFSLTAARLPSACAGFLAIFAIYRIGSAAHSQRLGLIAGWMLLTTFYFIFWARTSSADMLNLAGILLAFCWYFINRHNTHFTSYAIFFLIIAFTSLCKGLIGAVIPLLAILPDLLRRGQFRQHLNLNIVIAIIPALIIYLLPFVASTYIGGSNYHDDGLMQVYRENFLRYFQPFDHYGPIYTYIIYLPLYLLPWTVFFIPALIHRLVYRTTLLWHSRWFCWSVLLIFLFLTLSGSRRDYYVLCLVPFCILLTADWLVGHARNIYKKIAYSIIYLFFTLFIAYFIVLQPLNYFYGGHQVFAAQLKSAITQENSANDWHLVLLDPKSNLLFYLNLPPFYPLHSLKNRAQQTLATLEQEWPMLCEDNKKTVFISRLLYRDKLDEILSGYTTIVAPPTLLERWFGYYQDDVPIAYLPTLSATCKKTLR